MNKFLLLVSFLLSSFGFAQLTLEYSYLYQRDVKRIVLENSGEKYYRVDYQTGLMTFFNADHSYWKSVQLALPAQNYSVFISDVSQTKINPDSNIEIIYSTYSSPNLRQSKIVNELGEVLLSVENQEFLQFSQSNGLSGKVISSAGTVYAVPELTVEHVYPSSVQRVNLEVSGEKYYWLDKINGQVVMYHADHTFWKNIALPKPDGFSIYNVYFLSEKQINPDDLIEVGYSCFSDSQGKSLVSNENGQLLLDAVNPGQLHIDSIDGLPNKLMVYYMVGDVPDETSEQTDVYSLPSFNLEHTYDDTVFRVKLELSGEKYHAHRYDYLTTDITIFNQDHTVWKTIPTSAMQGGETIDNVFASETKINADAGLEVGYTITTHTLDGGHYRGYIVKDDASVLLEVLGAYDLSLSEFPNHSTKLIAHQQDGPSFDQLYYTSTVYRIDNPFSTQSFSDQRLSITPNPADVVLNINSKVAISEIEIYDFRGTLLKKVIGANIRQMNIEALSDGLYLVKVKDSSNKASWHKIMIAH